MIRIQEILDKVAAHNQEANLELIQRAYVFAASDGRLLYRESLTAYEAFRTDLDLYLAMLGLFSLAGCRATARHTRCRKHGAPGCVYEISW